MKFNALLSYPPNCKLTIDLTQDPIDERSKRELYATIQGNLKRGNAYSLHLDDVKTIIGFQRIGMTAGNLSLVWEQSRTVYGMCALLTKLDPAEDRKAIDILREVQTLKTVPAEAFEAPLKSTTPVCAAYFTHNQNLNKPIFHSLITIAAGVFFDQYGLAD